MPVGDYKEPEPFKRVPFPGAPTVAPQVTAPETPVGHHYSAGKLDYTLLPLPMLDGMVRILQDACEAKADGTPAKYSRFNWQHVENGEAEYRKSALRHEAALQAGEDIDPESGRPHEYHRNVDFLISTWHKFHPKGV